MSVDGKKLTAIVGSYEALDGQRREAQDDQAQLLKDAEEDGFDKKAIKRLIRYLRDTSTADAEQDVFDEYLAAYRTFESTPLGAHAAKQAEKKASASAVAAE